MLNSLLLLSLQMQAFEVFLKQLYLLRFVVKYFYLTVALVLLAILCE